MSFVPNTNNEILSSAAINFDGYNDITSSHAQEWDMMLDGTPLWPEAPANNGPNATPVSTASGTTHTPVLTATLHVQPYICPPTLERPRDSDPRETVSSPSPSCTVAPPLVASLTDPTNLSRNQSQVPATLSSSSRVIRNSRNSTPCRPEASAVPSQLLNEFPSAPNPKRGQSSGLEVQIEDGQIQPRKKLKAYGPRTAKACSCCRRAKTKCSGASPCKRCEKRRHLTCTYDDTPKPENVVAQYQPLPNVSLEQEDAGMEIDEGDMQDGMEQVAVPVGDVGQSPSTPFDFGDQGNVAHMVGVQSLMEEVVPMEKDDYVDVSSLPLIPENDQIQSGTDPDLLLLLGNGAPAILNRCRPTTSSHNTCHTTRENILRRIRAPPLLPREQRPEDLHLSTTLPARTSDQHLDDKLIWSEVLPMKKSDEPSTPPPQRRTSIYLSSEDGQPDDNEDQDRPNDNFDGEDGHDGGGTAGGGGDGGENSENQGPNGASYSCSSACNILSGELPPVPSQLTNRDGGDNVGELGRNHDGDRTADSGDGMCSNNETSFVNGDSHPAVGTWMSKITSWFRRGNSAREESVIQHGDQNNGNWDDEEYVFINHPEKDEGNDNSADENRGKQVDNVANDEPPPASSQKALEKEKAEGVVKMPKSHPILVAWGAVNKIIQSNGHDPTNTKPLPITIPRKGPGKRKQRNTVRRKLSRLERFLHGWHYARETGSTEVASAA